MAKYADKVDIYNDMGQKVGSNIPLESLSPLRNAAIKRLREKGCLL